MDDLMLTEEDIELLFKPRKKMEAHEAEPAELPLDRATDSEKLQPSPQNFPIQENASEFPTTQPTAPHTPMPPAQPIPPSPLHGARPVSAPPASSAPPLATPASTRYHSKGRRVARALIMFLLAFLLSFGLLNAGSIVAKLSFWWGSDIGGGQANTTTTPPPPPATMQMTPLPTNRLFVPKISVEAPILWDSPPQRVLSDLHNGVAHYLGTARPNRLSGNTFITGHSSNYLWDRGSYNHVFTNLDRLVAGDFVAVTTDDQRYLYRVKDQLVVKPTQLDVLNPTTQPILSLMTCTPVGTNLRRLIVRSDLVEVRPLSKTTIDQPLAL